MLVESDVVLPCYVVRNRRNCVGEETHSGKHWSDRLWIFLQVVARRKEA